MKTPMFKSIDYCDPLLIFERFHHKKWAIFFDSALYNDQYGRYSYIAFDPFKTFLIKDGQINIDSKLTKSDKNPFQILKNFLTTMSLDTIPELPPFQGGAAGAFSYDLYQYLEQIPAHAEDDMHFPDLAIGFYDVVISWDHQLKKTWIISTGWGEDRLRRANERLGSVITVLWGSNQDYFPLPSSLQQAGEGSITSNFSQERYKQAVLQVKDRIEAGDLFQANISQRFKAKLPTQLLPFDLYKQLRKTNPAPFAAFFNFDGFQVVSASPERFLQVNDGLVETRPIKGTRPRGQDLQQDACYVQDLENSEKDRAENIMIVDLMRNDLSKVCEDHSVKVAQLCGIESYATVHHLVSVITARLKDSSQAIDLLEAAFPGGSITGSPKIQAMHLIAGIEPSKRGLYCGSLGYLGFNGSMDTSIVIRTYIIKDSVVTFQAGGAVILDSDPEQEYEESLNKAKALYDLLKRHYDSAN